MFFTVFLLGTSSKRRTEEVKRLNELYSNILPDQETLQKCLKYLAETESYRMLKDWTYDLSNNPIEGEKQTSTAERPPDFTDVRCKHIYK